MDMLTARNILINKNTKVAISFYAYDIILLHNYIIETKYI